MVDKRKVLYELGEWTDNPLESQLAMKLIDSIDNNSPMGKMVIKLLEFAENGNFK